MNPIRKHAVRTASRSAAALGLVLGLGLSASAHADTGSTASLDWSSFSAVSTDPGFAFVVDPSYGTTVTAFTQTFSPSFTTAISAGDPATGVAASADAKSLLASVNSVTGLGYAGRSADVTRGADFTLDNGASVTFSINATVSTNEAASTNANSFASLTVLGGDLGYYNSAITAVANGTAESTKGVLTFTVTNTSGATVTSFLSAEGTVTVDAIPPVPEPSTLAMLLPGLLIGGFVISRRRAAQR